MGSEVVADSETPDEDFGIGGWAGLTDLPDLNKPVIAAVNGMAVGGGFEIALACDLLIASETARFSLPEMFAGVLADSAAIRLGRRLPYHVAVDMLLTGRWMEADEALRWGLVREVVPSGRAWRRRASSPTDRERAAAAVPGHHRDPARDGGDELSRRPSARRQRRAAAVAAPNSSEDMLEGARAFAEKRAPVWRGR